MFLHPIACLGHSLSPGSVDVSASPMNMLLHLEARVGARGDPACRSPDYRPAAGGFAGARHVLRFQPLRSSFHVDHFHRSRPSGRRHTGRLPARRHQSPSTFQGGIHHSPGLIPDQCAEIRALIRKYWGRLRAGEILTWRLACRKLISED